MGTELAELFAVLVFFVSYYGLATTRNILKSVVFVVFKEVSAIMFFLSIGYFIGIRAPIGEAVVAATDFTPFADPFPQALAITAIVIGLSVTTVMLVMTITIIRQFGSMDWNVIKAQVAAEAAAHDDDHDH